MFNIFKGQEKELLLKHLALSFLTHIAKVLYLQFLGHQFRTD